MKPLAPAHLALLALVAGCATQAPNAPPHVSVPPAFSRGPADAPSAPAAWWSAFNDAVLTSLIDRALADSPDLQIAVARVRQAREQERIVRGGASPQLNVSAQAADTKLSKNALPSGLTNLLGGNTGQATSGSGLGLPGESFTTYQLGFDASWELDLFGGRRSAERAAGARTEAAIWSARDAQVVLAAEVARTYQDHRALQRRLALAADLLASEREALSFTQVRFRNGLVMDAEVRQQEQAVDRAAAQRADISAQLDAHAHALGVLLGVAPNALAAELAAPPPSAPGQIEIPPGLPSELLQRRPDIRAAERELAAATSDVGVATADLYPKITLTGALQLASRSLSSLLESDSLQDNISGRVSFPLFDRGRLHANVRLRQAQADEAAVSYRRAVFGALRDVEDALTRLDADRRRADQLRAAALAAKDQADSAAVRYRNGLIQAADMLGARNAWRAAQDAQVQAEAAATEDEVALYKALGGGWDTQSSLTGGTRSGG